MEGKVKDRSALGPRCSLPPGVRVLSCHEVAWGEF
jgi:hypothetical protein